MNEKNREDDFDIDKIFEEAEEAIKGGEAKSALRLLGEVVGYYAQTERLTGETLELLHEAIRNLEGSLGTLEKSLKLSKDFQKIIGQLLMLLGKE